MYSICAAARAVTPSRSPRGTLIFWRTGVSHDWTRVNSEWYAVRNGAVERFRIEHSIYSGRELRALLLQAGFSDVRLFGDLDGREYGLDAARLVAVARRSAPQM